MMERKEEEARPSTRRPSISSSVSPATDDEKQDGTLTSSTEESAEIARQRIIDSHLASQDDATVQIPSDGEDTEVQRPLQRYLDELESLRRKSSNLQDAESGRMERLIRCAKSTSNDIMQQAHNWKNSAVQWKLLYFTRKQEGKSTQREVEKLRRENASLKANLPAMASEKSAREGNAASSGYDSIRTRDDSKSPPQKEPENKKKSQEKIDREAGGESAVCELSGTFQSELAMARMMDRFLGAMDHILERIQIIHERQGEMGTLAAAGSLSSGQMIPGTFQSKLPMVHMMDHFFGAMDHILERMQIIYERQGEMGTLAAAGSLSSGQMVRMHGSRMHPSVMGLTHWTRLATSDIQ